MDFEFSSTPSPSSLFMPVLGPGKPFWFVSTLGTTHISGGLGAGEALISGFSSGRTAFSFEAAGIGVDVEEDLG